MERTGGRAERTDQLMRLGYRIPEKLAEAPEYPRAMAQFDWSSQEGWYHATKNVGRKVSFFVMDLHENYYTFGECF